MSGNVLCLNAGSSSLKFSLYDLDDLEKVVMSGEAEKIGMRESRLKIELRGHPFSDEEIALPTHEMAVSALLSTMSRTQVRTPIVCVHRVVHGGSRFFEPVLITEGIKRELKSLVALAPLHMPIELSVIEAASRVYPDSSQVACFDTAFHQRMPEVAKRLPLPRGLWGEDVRRYGFHGLSYEYIVSRLGKQLTGRAIIAHLGNGCSMVALKDGIPQDTTMGLTPTGGLMMGTRSGDLDPGVIFYLLRNATAHSQDAIAQVERTLNDESGLIGVSGISRNMEDLLKAERESVTAKEAIELFCYCARKFVGSLYAVLGGLDTLVFTGGIGENSAVIRNRICEDLSFLDFKINRALNEANAPVISSENSPRKVYTLRTNENLMMAKHASTLLSKGRS